MSAARTTEPWISSETYTASGGALRSPSSRTLLPPRASRASLRPVKFAIDPPERTIPPLPSGSPNRCANHCVRCSSISVAPGASCHPPTFWFSPAASRSANAPGTVPGPTT